MDKQERVNQHAGKTRSAAGATPPCRKIAARSLRASGVTPASCCWKSQLVFGRVKQRDQRMCKTVGNTKLQRRNRKDKWQSSKHHPSNPRH